MERGRRTEGTQENRVLEALESAQNGLIRGEWVLDGGWVNKQYFLKAMGLTQSGRAIWNLENRRGVPIEHSDFRDQYGFCYYRLQPEQPTLL